MWNKLIPLPLLIFLISCPIVLYGAEAVSGENRGASSDGPSLSELFENADAQIKEIKESYKTTIENRIQVMQRQHFSLVQLDLLKSIQWIHEEILFIEERALQSEFLLQQDLDQSRDLISYANQQSFLTLSLEAQIQKMEHYVTSLDSLIGLSKDYCAAYDKTYLQNQFDPWQVAPPIQIKLTDGAPGYNKTFVMVIAGSDEEVNDGLERAQRNNGVNKVDRGVYTGAYATCRVFESSASSCSIFASVVTSVFSFLNPVNIFTQVNKVNDFNRLVNRMKDLGEAYRTQLPSRKFSDQSLETQCTAIFLAQNSDEGLQDHLQQYLVATQDRIFIWKTRLSQSKERLRDLGAQLSQEFDEVQFLLEQARGQLHQTIMEQFMDRENIQRQEQQLMQTLLENHQKTRVPVETYGSFLENEFQLDESLSDAESFLSLTRASEFRPHRLLDTMVESIRTEGVEE